MITTTTRATRASICDLDYTVEADGIMGDPVNLLLLADTARDLGVSDVLVSLMIDEEEPEVARIRAYARVSVQVSDRLLDTVERELLAAC